MPSQQQRVLQLRQLELRLRSAELRIKLVQEGEALRAPLALADQVHQTYCWLRARPLGSIAGALGLMLALGARKPRRLLRWVAKGLWAWRLLRRLTASTKKS